MMKPSADDLLYDAFLGKDELVAWDELIQQSREAIEKGTEVVEVPTAVLAMLLPELQSPLSFAAYREVWNRICDEQGHPELKKEDVPPVTDIDVAEDGNGPF